ncbi:hypothetical protein MGSAQ_000491 [marine sediment metagenome]|uniref:Uncharacterized protein n=1 Tax=marine sediment metagenome TaxID=412755 RepID=A0A1B6NX79_9ZZZZ
MQTVNLLRDTTLLACWLRRLSRKIPTAKLFTTHACTGILKIS